MDLRATRRLDDPTTDRAAEASTLPRAVDPPGADAGVFGRGRSIGRYLILRTLGVGGMGMVFLADDPELDRKVAVKLLRPLNDQTERDGQLHILAEAQAIARLSHPNVVAVYDVGSFEQGVFVAMEYIEGPSLRKWLAKKRSVDAILDVMLAAGRGLAAAHDAGLIHRDIKPDNILVADDGRVRVVDFGLAENQNNPSMVSSDVSWPTDLPPDPRQAPEPKRRQIVGTPRYMAPELFEEDEATIHSDQFAFCVTLFEALFGVPPYPKLSGHQWKRDFSQPPVAIPSTRSSVPSGLRPVLERGLSIDPERRFASMHDLLARLTRLRNRRQRRLTIVGAVAVMGAGIAIGLAPGNLGPKGPCAHAADPIDAVWNSDARQSITRAFEATALPFAERSATDVASTLDAFVEEWRAARTQACTATVIDRTDSGAMMDLRFACLEQRRDHLAALVETLSSADRATVEHATEAARSLPQISECTDRRVLAALPPLPTDPALRVQVELARADLAELSAARRSGNLHRAEQLARTLRASIVPLSYDPLTAELELETGRTDAVLRHHGSAEQHLRAALFAAARGGYERVRGEAWLALARALGVEQKQFGAGREALEAAEASLAARGEDPEHFEALLLTRVDLAVARDELGAAEDLLKAMLERNDLAIERHELLARLGQVTTNLASSIDLLREAVEVQRTSLGPAHPRLATTMLTLAKRLSDNHLHDEAIGIAEQARRIREPLFEPGSVAIAKIYETLGYIEGRRGQSEQAVTYFQQATELMRQDPDHVEFELATAVMNTGVMLSRLGRHAEARQLHRQAREIFERTDPEHPRIAVPLMNTAVTYRREGAYEQALEWYERAIAWMMAGPRPGHPVASLELDVAELHLELGRIDKALHYVNRAEIRTEHLVGHRKHRLFHKSWRVRAMIELRTEDYAAAAEAAARSLELHQEVVPIHRDSRTLAHVRFIRAQALRALGREAEALSLAREAQREFDGTDMTGQQKRVREFLGAANSAEPTDDRDTP